MDLTRTGCFFCPERLPLRRMYRRLEQEKRSGCTVIRSVCEQYSKKENSNKELKSCSLSLSGCLHLLQDYLDPKQSLRL